MTDVYRAPDFDFGKGQGQDGPSDLLQRGIEGNYRFAAFEAIDEVWSQVKGKKGVIWIGWFLTIAVSIGVSMATGVLGAALGYSGGFEAIFQHGVPHNQVVTYLFAVAQNIVQMLITLPVQLGFFMLMLKKLVGLPTDAGELFQHYGKTLKDRKSVV